MNESLNFEKYQDTKVLCQVEIGRTFMTLKEILNFEKGTIIDLGIPAGENMNIYINKTLVGKGEILVYEKNLVCRINSFNDIKNNIEDVK